MSNNKQNSSIEWFAKESWKLRVELEDGKISFGEYANKYYQLKEQAKAMHKEEMDKVAGDFWNEGASYMYNGQRKYNSFEQYYNETFGGENED